MRIRYLSEADDDLEGVKRHYLEVGGKALALRMVRSIRKAVAGLSDNPNIAPPYEIAKGVRRLVVADGAYLAFYRVREVIEVIHIRRAEREPATADELDV